MKKYPIMILHGWNLDSSRFRPLAKELQKRSYQVLCPDLPGFGKSAIERAYNLEDYVSFVEDYLKKKSIKKVVLICHSFGGRIGIKLTATDPDLVQTLILTGVPGFVPVSKSKITFFLFVSKLGKVVFSLPPLSFFANFARKLLYRLAQASDYYNSNGFMRETFKSVIRKDLSTSMETIRKPTLLVWGQGDTIVPLTVAQKMKEAIKNSRLIVVPAATHRLPYNDPDKFLEVVRKYLK